MKRLLTASLLCLSGLAHSHSAGDSNDLVRLLAELDTRYQRAVEINDWRTMDEILHADFVLVLGDGRSLSRAALIDSARTAEVEYTHQVEVAGTQTVRLFGADTATITALLINRGTVRANGRRFDQKIWFTDTYVRTPQGWKYAFGQASLPLPAEPD